MNDGLTELLVLPIAAAAFFGFAFLVVCLVFLNKRWIKSTKRRRSYHRVQTIANFTYVLWLSTHQSSSFVADNRTHSNDTQFAYKCLSKSRREIRLLRILPKPSSSEVQSGIECEPFHALLDDPELKYCALSYVWGKSPSRSTIQFGGNPSVWAETFTHLFEPCGFLTKNASSGSTLCVSISLI